MALMKSTPECPLTCVAPLVSQPDRSLLYALTTGNQFGETTHTQCGFPSHTMWVSVRHNVGGTDGLSRGYSCPNHLHIIP